MKTRTTAFLFAISLTGMAFSAPGDVARVSVSGLGSQANNRSFDASMSADGRYVVFSSEANNLVPGDTNTAFDIFLFDRNTGGIERVSLTNSGGQANGSSLHGSISADGRYVSFSSTSDNLVTGDTNVRQDMFVRDRQTGTTERVTVTSAGAQTNGNTVEGRISGNGRYVVFHSDGTNVVPGDTNAAYDVFIRDLLLGTTERVSLTNTEGQSNGGTIGATVSDDGRVVAFWSTASNLVAGDTNGVYDAFVRDRQAGTTKIVSVNNSGVQGNRRTERPMISGNGRYVVFPSIATNLVTGDSNPNLDIFVRDLQLSKTTMVSVSSMGVQADLECNQPSISTDGRVVAFSSPSKILISGDTSTGWQVFAKDRLTGHMKRVSQTSAGLAATQVSEDPMLSSDGQFVVFESHGDNLVIGDTNEAEDVFVSEAGLVQITGLLVSRNTAAGQNSITGTVALDTPAAFGGATVALSTSSGSVSVPAQVVVPFGASTKNFAISTMPVSTSTVVTIFAQIGSQIVATPITLVPLVPSAFQFMGSPVTGGTDVTTRLVLNGTAPTGGQLVTLSDNNVNALTPPFTTVPAGQQQISFTISTVPVVATQYVTVTATTPGGSKTGVFVIRP